MFGFTEFLTFYDLCCSTYGLSRKNDRNTFVVIFDKVSFAFFHVALRGQGAKLAEGA